MKQRLVHTIAQEHIPGLTEIVKLEGRFATINAIITELLGPAIADRLATLRATTSTPTISKSTVLATPIITDAIKELLVTANLAGHNGMDVNGYDLDEDDAVEPMADNPFPT